MFRAKIRLNEQADVNVESSLLKKRAEREGLSAHAVESLIGSFSLSVVPLIESGRLMKSQGSSFNVTRTIKGPGYDVKLAFATGSNQSVFAKIKNLIWGR
jgi:hypothetical protein